MQSETIVHGIKVADFPDDHLTIRGILQHNHNWDRYRYTHRDDLRPVEQEEAQKLLGCHAPEQGGKTYICPDPECGHIHTVTFGCNSRLCSGCGKPHADRWAKSLRRTILPLPDRHITFTIPSELWPLVKRHRSPLLKIMMDAAVKTLDEVLSQVIRGPFRKRVGAVAVLHPFGRDLDFKPHVHVICLEGVIECGRFVPKTFFPMNRFRKTWQNQVLTAFRKALKKADEQDSQAEPLIKEAFRKWPNGFYVHLTKETRVDNPDKILRYVGRYVRHPAIAESRLVGYDGQGVTFQWQDHQSGATKHRTMEVEDFIGALLQHVMERHFKVVRHYGVYSRGLKKLFRGLADKWSMVQTTLGRYTGSQTKGRVVLCPKCGQEMDFLLYDRPPPDKTEPFGSKIDDLRHLTSQPQVSPKAPQAP